jgi:hypothetical protein
MSKYPTLIWRKNDIADDKPHMGFQAFGVSLLGFRRGDSVVS